MLAKFKSAVGYDPKCTSEFGYYDFSKWAPNLRYRLTLDTLLTCSPCVVPIPICYDIASLTVYATFHGHAEAAYNCPYVAASSPRQWQTTTPVDGVTVTVTCNGDAVFTVRMEDATCVAEGSSVVIPLGYVASFKYTGQRLMHNPIYIYRVSGACGALDTTPLGIELGITP